MKNYRNVILLGIALIIAAVTNPHIEDHERAVVSESMQQYHVTRTNLIFFSLTNVNSKNVGFGAFGTVVVNADMAAFRSK